MRPSSVLLAALLAFSCSKPRVTQGSAEDHPPPTAGGAREEPLAGPAGAGPRKPPPPAEPAGAEPEAGNDGGDPNGGTYREPPPQPAAEVELRVYAAPSLAGALTELGRQFTEAHPGTTITVTAEPFYDGLKRMGDEGGDVLVPEGYTALEAARAAGIARADGAVTVNHLPLVVTVAGPKRAEIDSVAALAGHLIGVPESSSSTAGDGCKRLLDRANVTGTQERVIPGDPASALKDGTVDAFISWGRVTAAGVPLSIPVGLEELLPIPAVVTTFSRHEAAAQAFVSWLTEDAARRTFEKAGGVPVPEAGRRRVGTVLPVRLPGPRRQAAAATAGGRIVLFGGEAGGTFLDSLVWVDLATYRIYDAVAKLSAPRGGAAAGNLVAAGGIFVLGGREATGVVDTIERFEPKSETITTLEQRLPTPLEGAASLVSNDRLYLFGGFDGSAVATDAIVVFDPATNTARTLEGRLPAPVGEAAAAPGTNGTVWLFGGRNGDGPTANIVSFDLASGKSQITVGRLPEPRHGLGVVTWKDGWLVVGGHQNGGLSDALDIVRLDGTRSRLDVRLPSGGADATVLRSGDSVYVLGGTTLSRVESRIVRLPE